nr:RDD family protein [uncultured Carboxylicivirga sp.]
MNRQEQLQYCKACKNQKFDQQEGIICSITNRRADFTDRCSSFVEDDDLSHKMAMNDIRTQLITQEATKGSRFANYLIDIFIIQLLGFIVGMIVGVILLIFAPSSAKLLEEDIFSYLLFIMVGISYYTLMEATTGRTIGKLITRTKVVSENGEKMGITTALLRSASRFVPFDALSFLGENGWHDKWTNTMVVKLK